MVTEAEFNKLTEKERLNSTLEGEFYWAFLSKPKVSERFKTTKYQTNLVVDEANQAKAIAMGLKVRPADKYTPGPWVEISRKITDPSKIETNKPEVVDAMQRAVPSDMLVGNGSKGIVKFGRYWFPNNGGGVGTVLFKAQIRHLVEYKKDDGFVKDPEGFQAPATQGGAAQGAASGSANDASLEQFDT